MNKFAKYGMRTLGAGLALLAAVVGIQKCQNNDTATAPISPKKSNNVASVKQGILEKMLSVGTMSKAPTITVTKPATESAKPVVDTAEQKAVKESSKARILAMVHAEQAKRKAAAVQPTVKTAVAPVTTVSSHVAAQAVQSPAPAVAPVVDTAAPVQKVEKIAAIASIDSTDVADETNDKIIPKAFIDNMFKEISSSMYPGQVDFQSKSATSAISKLDIKTSVLGQPKKMATTYLVVNQKDSSLYALQSKPVFLGKRMVSYYLGTSGKMDAFGQEVYNKAAASIDASDKKVYKSRLMKYEYEYNSETKEKTNVLLSDPIGDGLFINKIFTENGKSFTVNKDGNVQRLPSTISVFKKETELAKTFQQTDLKKASTAAIALMNQ